MLKDYLTLKMEIAEKQKQLGDMLIKMQTKVNSTDEPIREWGAIAYFKNGRKATNHKQAVIDAGDEVSKDIIDEFTTHKTSTSWAKVTKKAKVDTSDYVTYGDPVFVVEMEE